MKIAAILLLSITLLSACSGANDPRYLISAPPGERTANLLSRTIEVRQVSLPSYAAGSDIVVQGEGGALFTQDRAQWADDPARGMTSALARGLSERTGASVAAEPWPLNTGPDVRLDVRIDQAYARADGNFELSGQYAVLSPEGTVREFVRRFNVVTPIVGSGAPATADALGRALAELSRQMSQAM
ncbi:PqiC family protein [uncultured Ruegeria sp.]|uniref:PqiC family protein n=1 Tax=uncultured Ruegeria sp. TaxID=259304 RepID=UPI00261FA3CE|nr:PqiC family protein [uncultured Ruegeria sp.]